jgi:hypothetical protein
MFCFNYFLQALGTHPCANGWKLQSGEANTYIHKYEGLKCVYVSIFLRHFPYLILRNLMGRMIN